MTLIVGPCSIHDPEAAKAYGRKLAQIKTELEKVERTGGMDLPSGQHHRRGMPRGLGVLACPQGTTPSTLGTTTRVLGVVPRHHRWSPGY